MSRWKSLKVTSVTTGLGFGGRVSTRPSYGAVTTKSPQITHRCKNGPPEFHRIEHPVQQKNIHCSNYLRIDVSTMSPCPQTPMLNEPRNFRRGDILETLGFGLDRNPLKALMFGMIFPGLLHL
jgi:hypothetical protein